MSRHMLMDKNKSSTRFREEANRPMPYDVRSVANLILDFADRANSEVTNITINKIVFFLHAWYLAKTGAPLVTAKIEAWNYGPVFRELYWEFKEFGKEKITARATRRNPMTATKEVCAEPIADADLEFLRPLLEKYLKLSAAKLVELSHVPGGPWDQVYNHVGKSNPGMRISDELIRDFFQKQTRH
jgi:uncharacterized phage-associated protein